MTAVLNRLRRSRILLIGLLIVALVGTTTAVVAAVVTSNSGPFTGCLSKFGLIYHAKAGGAPLASCLRGDTQIAFSNGQALAGPQGIQGLPGQDGAPGAPGADGAPGAPGTKGGPAVPSRRDLIPLLTNAMLESFSHSDLEALLQAGRWAACRRTTPETPLSSTGPNSVKVALILADASTTSWVTSTSRGRAYSAIRDARLTVSPK
jgi:hypothetical protein